MQVIVNCQRCNGALTITPEMGGQVYACPYCAQPFTAPQLQYPQQALPAAPRSLPPSSAPPTMAAPHASPPTNPKPPILPPANTLPPVMPPAHAGPLGFPQVNAPSSAPGFARKPRQYVWEVNLGLAITAAVIFLIGLGCPVVKMRFSPGGPAYLTILKWQMESGTFNHLTIAVLLVIAAAVLTIVLALMKKYTAITIAAGMAAVSLLITVSSYKGDSSYGMIVVLVGALVACAAALVRVRKA